MAWTEDELHRWLGRGPARAGRGGAAGKSSGAAVALGSAGHDGAELRALVGLPVLCVDACVEGVHFEPGTPARAAGHKAVARALSDLAACAARPRGVLLALRAPAEAAGARLRGLLDGVRRAGETLGAPLVGGDTTCASGPLSLTVTAFGERRGSGRSPRRDRARPGAVVGVTGALGGSRLGRHLRIAPRLAAGEALARAGATALMDVSDGLAWDLFRLARAAGVAVELDLARVPVHRDARRAARADGRDALDHALHDGEDHELLAVLPTAAARRLEARGLPPGPAGDGAPLPFTVIGRVRPGAGLELLDGTDRRPWDGEGGWRHGG